MLRRVTQQTVNKAGTKRIPQGPFQKIYNDFKYPKTELGHIAKSIFISLGICSVAIGASLLGLR